MTVFDIFVPTSNQLQPLLKSLYSVPVSAGIKNATGEYLSCNQEVAEYAGVSSPKDIEGKTDADLIWKENAKIYQEHDQLVERTGKTAFFLEPHVDKEIIYLLGIKAPLSRFCDSFSGMVGAGLVINQPSFQSVLSQLIQVAEILKFDTQMEILLQIITQAMKMSQLHAQYPDRRHLFDYGKIVFSFREAQCLHYFFNHYSAEKTSEKIHISRKTVEFHLAKIKQKLNCHHSSQLTRLAVDYGFIDLMFMPF